MSLSWISIFLEAQAADFGAARNTQEAYGRDLKDFLAYLEARGAGFATATRAMVEDYLVHCDAAGLASATKARRLSVNQTAVPVRLRRGAAQRQPGHSSERTGQG